MHIQYTAAFKTTKVRSGNRGKESSSLGSVQDNSSKSKIALRATFNSITIAESTAEKREKLELFIVSILHDCDIPLLCITINAIHLKCTPI